MVKKTGTRCFDDVAELVGRAAAGDQDAWARLTRRFDPLLRSIAASYGIPAERAADLAQTAWLRLLTHLRDLRAPELVGPWLSTTMRRLCLESLRRGQRELLTSDDWYDQVDVGDPPDAGLIRAERAERVMTALRQLPERQQRLMWYLATNPDGSYKDISVTLGMPVGAIGPTRARAVERLQNLLREDQLVGALAD